MQRPKTLREMTYDALLDALIRNNGSRTHAADELGISIRCARNIIGEMRRKGIMVPKGSSTSGFERMLQELKEYREGKRVTSQVQTDYCKGCGRILTGTHTNLQSASNEPKDQGQKSQT